MGLRLSMWNFDCIKNIRFWGVRPEEQPLPRLLKSSKGLGKYAAPSRGHSAVVLETGGRVCPLPEVTFLPHPAAGTLSMLLSAGLRSLLCGENLKGEYCFLRGKFNAPV